MVEESKQKKGSSCFLFILFRFMGVYMNVCFVPGVCSPRETVVKQCSLCRESGDLPK